ncbi:MAG: cob(I)yrinic acid a,c-diamide adenosyltransferase [Nitrososphaerota archaeon]
MVTGRGDNGETDLLGGVRVHKSHPRIECLGELDELSSFIGYSISLSRSRYPEITNILFRIQNDLFRIGTEIASMDKINLSVTPVNEEDINNLEKLIMNYQGELTELKQFVYPGGSLLGASIHIARAVARRTERRLVALKLKEQINPLIIKYLNRLSTLLFVLARYINKLEEVQENLWSRKQ